jgi:hypothetical protein
MRINLVNAFQIIIIIIIIIITGYQRVIRKNDQKHVLCRYIIRSKGGSSKLKPRACTLRYFSPHGCLS